MRFLGSGVGHCSQHSAQRAGNDGDGSQMCVANDESINDADNDEEDEEAVDDEDEVTEDEVASEDEVTESEDIEMDDDDVGYDAL